MAEYALILGGIAIVVIAAIVFLGRRSRPLRVDGLLGQRLPAGLTLDVDGGGSTGTEPAEPPPSMVATLYAVATEQVLRGDGDRADDVCRGTNDDPTGAASCGKPQEGAQR